MTFRRFAGGLLTVTLATGLLVAGAATSASAHHGAAVQTIASSHNAAKVKRPVLLRPRYTCHESGAVVVIKLRNPNRTDLVFEARLDGRAYSEALPVDSPARGVASVEFHGVPDGRYLVNILTHLGEHVAETRFRVRCGSSAAIHPQRVRGSA